MIQVTPVILCGCSGTRLWPLARGGFPKQFLCLTGDNSLFQQTAERLQGLDSTTIQAIAPLIVCNEEHRFLAQEQLRESGIKGAKFLLEPIARNTAPALTLAALAAQDGGADPVLVVTPADQAVSRVEIFIQAVKTAITEAATGSIVILGIQPDRPETGYGYIKAGASANTQGTVTTVERFVEKPNLETAQAYVNEGSYFWNAGIFVLKASVWLKAMETFQPEMLIKIKHAWESRQPDSQFLRPGKAEFEQVPGESIDYAVMERCPGSAFATKMVSLNAGWSDLGAWDAVWNIQEKDADGNAHKGDVISKDCRDTFVHASSRLVSWSVCKILW